MPFDPNKPFDLIDSPAPAEAPVSSGFNPEAEFELLPEEPQQTIKPQGGFMGGVERTIEGVPRVASNIAGGMISGLADLGRSIASVPSPLDLIGVTKQPKEPKIFGRIEEAGKSIAQEPESPEFKTARFFAPVPPVGKAVKGGKKLTAFGKAVKELPFDDRVKAERALDKLDELGAKSLDVEARAKVIDSLDLPTGSSEVGDMILSKLSKKTQEAKTRSDLAYGVADEIASETRVIDTRNTIDVLGARPSKDLKKKRKAYDEIKAILTENPEVNAKTIEDKLKALKEDQRAAKAHLSPLYSKAIEDLTNKQNDLLKEIGQTGIYDEARDLWSTYKKEYRGELEGLGITGGKAIKSVLKSRDNFDTAKKILTAKIEPNRASQISKNFNPQERRDMVMSVLADGIDTGTGLNTPENVVKLVNNFEKMNKDGLISMIGRKGYDDTKKTIDALSFVESAVRVSDKKTMDIKDDILQLGAALAAAKISPYAAVHVSINKAKNIISKTALKNYKNQLIQRTKEVKDPKVRRVLFDTIKALQPVGVATQEAIRATLPKEEE